MTTRRVRREENTKYEREREREREKKRKHKERGEEKVMEEMKVLSSLRKQEQQR